MDLAQLIALLRRRNLVASATVDRLEGLDALDQDALDDLEGELVATFDRLDDAAEPNVEAMELVASALEHVRATDPDDAPTPRARLGDVAARNGPRTRPRRSDPAPTTITAGGRPIDAGDLPGAFLDALRDLSYRKPNGDERRTIARLSVDVPEDRRLGDDPTENLQRVREVVSPEALVAAGGLCAPVGARYDVETIATPDRPVRDALPFFQAERGGVRFLPPPTLADVAGGVTVWTEANDAEPGSDGPATKPVHTAECGVEQEVKVHAVPYRLRVGNFNARTHPEQVEALLELLRAQQARTAEGELLDGIRNGSTAVTASRVLGAARDLLATIDRAAAAYRSRNRTSPTAMLRVVLPAWARDLARADLARQLAGDDTLAVSDERIAEWFSRRHISPVWSVDLDAFGAQEAGLLLDFPATLEFFLYAEGTHVFLDGGELDLGLIRSPDLNSTNDAEVFAETFEGVATIGVESLAVTVDVCADGTSQGTVAATICGS